MQHAVSLSLAANEFATAVLLLLLSIVGKAGVGVHSSCCTDRDHYWPATKCFAMHDVIRQLTQWYVLTVTFISIMEPSS